MIVEELWVYPVKGCQGISVPEARLTATGLEYDRALCIVDTEGLVVAKNEAISMRKIPALATIQVEYLNSQREILLTGGDGESIKLPLNEKDYVINDDIVVSCSGKSTTTGGGWSLGTIPCKLGDRKANDWITAYLNHQDKNGKFRHGKSLRTSFAFARSVSTLQLRNYPEIFPIISAARADGRLGRNEKRFSDFAPLLICNRASLERVKSLGNVKDYPMESMRASIIVDSKQSWSEERWKYIYVQGNNKEPLTLSKIKECPRCTVPCRHPKTGKYLFPEKLLLWKVLKKAFPQKASDPEWGSWAGVYFGVYFGNNGNEGIIQVGDQVQTSSEPSNLSSKRSVVETIVLKFRKHKMLLRTMLLALLFILFRSFKGNK